MCDEQRKIFLDFVRAIFMRFFDVSWRLKTHEFCNCLSVKAKRVASFNLAVKFNRSLDLFSCLFIVLFVDDSTYHFYFFATNHRTWKWWNHSESFNVEIMHKANQPKPLSHEIYHDSTWRKTFLFDTHSPPSCNVSYRFFFLTYLI